MARSLVARNCKALAAQLLPEIRFAGMIPGAVRQRRPVDASHRLIQVRPVMSRIAIQEWEHDLVVGDGSGGHHRDGFFALVCQERTIRLLRGRNQTGCWAVLPLSRV